MSRVDRASRWVAAPPTAVYRALVGREALETWLAPAGMTGRIELFDPRPGGGFRMVLTYLDPEGAPGKSGTDTDVVDVELAELVADQ